MPAPVVAAGITAGAGLVGSALSSRSSNRGADAQERANQAAIDYQRERDAREDDRDAREQEALQAKWDAEQSRRLPYRQTAFGIMNDRMGGGLDQSFFDPREMPEGWTPGMNPNEVAALADKGGQIKKFGDLDMPVDPSTGFVPPAQPRRLTLADLGSGGGLNSLKKGGIRPRGMI